MPPFQVIQETPKPDYVGGFMQGFGWGQGVVDQMQERRLRQQQADLYRQRMQQSMTQDQWKFQQLQEETTRRRIASTKVAEVLGRSIQEKWDTDRTMKEMTAVRDFTETEVGNMYAKQWAELNDPERRLRMQNTQSMIDARNQGTAFDRRRAQADQDLADGLITPEQHQRLILGGRPPTERIDLQVERVKQLVADKTLTPEEGDLALKRLTKVVAVPSPAGSKATKMTIVDKNGVRRVVMVPSDLESFNQWSEGIIQQGGSFDPKGSETGSKELLSLSQTYGRAAALMASAIQLEKADEYAKKSQDLLTEYEKARKREKQSPQQSETPIKSPDLSEYDQTTREQIKDSQGNPVTTQAAPQSANDPLRINVPYAPGVSPTDAPRSTQTAPVATPAQTPAPAETQATEAPARDFAKESSTITPELARKYSDTAKRKLGKYATIGNIRAYARQLAKAAGYRVD